MAGSFSGIGLASRALQAFQRGLDVTGHNIANVNTRGYSRQSISFAPNDPSTYWGINPYQVGNGVSVASVSRIRDLLLDSRMNSAQSDLSKFSSLAASLKGIEAAMPEPSPNGIAEALNKFFDAWSGLASNPGESGLKLQVQLAGQTLTQRVRAAYAELGRQTTAIKTGIESGLGEVDRLTERISTLNNEIKSKAAAGADPNDLMDQRNLALEDLSKLIDIQTYEGADGAITVYTNQMQLVDTAGWNPIPKTYDPATSTLTGGPVPVTLRSGGLVGMMQSLSKLTGVQGQLNLFADQLRSEVNAVHRTGTTSGGMTNVDFFNTTVNGAENFTLGADVAASPDRIATGTSGNAGDGGVALALSNLREQSIGALGGKTFKQFYAGAVSGIGTEYAHY
ncbi:MAG TPA: flagellar hook-associated protein FlgK, partial [Fimbriimonadaceae bacterium]|nr:flagellar hook-associated protein FlgK [Fimbriimonadaceae bacterium]